MELEAANKVIYEATKTRPLTFNGEVLMVSYNVLVERFSARTKEDKQWFASTITHLRTRVELAQALEHRTTLQGLLNEAKNVILDANRNGFTRGQPLLARINDALRDTMKL